MEDPQEKARHLSRDVLRIQAPPIGELLSRGRPGGAASARLERRGSARAASLSGRAVPWSSWSATTKVRKRWRQNFARQHEPLCHGSMQIA